MKLRGERTDHGFDAAAGSGQLLERPWGPWIGHVGPALLHKWNEGQKIPKWNK